MYIGDVKIIRCTNKKTALIIKTNAISIYNAIEKLIIDFDLRQNLSSNLMTENYKFNDYIYQYDNLFLKRAYNNITKESLVLISSTSNDDTLV